MPVYWICSPSLSAFISATRTDEITGSHTGFEFLDGELPGLAMSADCFVDPSICSRTDEADDLVAVDDTNLTLVADIRTDSAVSRV
jgi:hypothetical protein